MGFCFNHNANMLHAVKKSGNKKRQSSKAIVIRKPTVGGITHHHKQLSAEDYRFLRSIGLKVRSHT